MIVIALPNQLKNLFWIINTPTLQVKFLIRALIYAFPSVTLVVLTNVAFLQWDWNGGERDVTSTDPWSISFSSGIGEIGKWAADIAAECVS